MNNFKLNQDAYIVQDYKIFPVRINAIITREDKSGKTLKYEVRYPNEKLHQISEAFLVGSWKDARKIALDNWRNIYKKVLKDLETNKGFSFEEAKKIVEERLKEKNASK